MSKQEEGYLNKIKMKFLKLRELKQFSKEDGQKMLNEKIQFIGETALLFHK